MEQKASSAVGDIPDNVFRFPVEARMPSHVAERKIGSVRRYRYPDVDTIAGGDIEKWLEKFLVGKSVLMGWTPVNEGLVSAFKKKNVRHIISAVQFRGSGERPLVELCCGGSDLYQVYNWATEKTLKSKRPVSLLALDQYQYFRECKRCEEYLRKVERATSGD